MPDRTMSDADLKALEDALVTARQQIDEAVNTVSPARAAGLARGTVNTGCNTGCSCRAAQ